MNLHDMSAIGNSEQLAMVKIEEMEDYDTVQVLIGNLNDIIGRANDRRKQLLAAMRTDNVWFDVLDTFDDTTYRAMWLRKQKNGYKAQCDNCGVWVAGNVRRLLVANGKGKLRNGHHHQFVCMQCASDRWQTP
jgi:hypothetical protein